MINCRYDWTLDEVLTLFHTPLLEICDRAKKLHREVGNTEIQRCELLSVKTGGCPENCSYCSQSAHFKTDVKASVLMEVDTVVAMAKSAKDRGATRFCLGAAWRQVPAGPAFKKVLQMVEGVAQEGMEVCCTLGMATASQLTELKRAGLTAYNHNLDTAREFYPSVTSTRDYDDRLKTIAAAREAGVQVCCGGILGLGESETHRAMLLRELASMQPHPESVPINMLVPVSGTPLAGNPVVPFAEFLRMIAIARLMLPHSRVRLSAGRHTLSSEQQRACFEVGANSIFVGEKLLTTPNVNREADEALLATANAQ